MNRSLDILLERVNAIPQASYPHHSRVHKLRSFDYPTAQCFIKRDDELGFGISGSKIRKYRSLIPWLMHQGIKEVALIGSASSNHVLGLSQLLIENNLKPTLFLRGDPSYSLKGNCLLTTLLVPSSSVHWVAKNEWHAAETMAHNYALSQPHATFVLPEGGSIAASLPGALTLVIDILENEKTTEIPFDHIFIEAGTGFTACALILGSSWLGSHSSIHVVLLAEDQAAFHRCLADCHSFFQDLMQTRVPYPQNFVLHEPQLTGSFGKTSPLIFQSIKQIACKEGFLTDPVYSAKLLIEGKQILSRDEIKGNILFLHAGGALSLAGFRDHLM